MFSRLTLLFDFTAQARFRRQSRPRVWIGLQVYAPSGREAAAISTPYRRTTP